jgi:hypothetical protein
VTVSSNESERTSPAPRIGGDDPLDELLDKLVAVLWDERELLRRLQFHLVNVSLIVRSGDWQWISDIDRDLLATSERLKRTEVVRAGLSLRLAEAVGGSCEDALDALSRAVDEPWQSILLDHDRALRELTVAVDDAAIAAESWLKATEGYDFLDLQGRFPLLDGGPSDHAPGAGS